MQPKRVLCVQDIACVGRCSLAVALPVLCAMGIQACPLPTALLPTHPLGFAPPQHTDETAFCTAALASLHAQTIAFDAVLCGYLAGAAQVPMAKAAFAQTPTALKILDPVMADHGKLYGSTTADFCEAMCTLCRSADVLTPNVTESAILLGLAPCDDAMDDAAIATRMLSLRSAYPNAVCIVVTGVGHTDSRAGNAVLTQTDAAPAFLAYDAVPQSYPGTGDLFAAVLTGGLLRGDSAQAAVTHAAAFVASAASATLAHSGDPRHGVHFEPLLASLATP